MNLRMLPLLLAFACTEDLTTDTEETESEMDSESDMESESEMDSESGMDSEPDGNFSGAMSVDATSQDTPTLIDLVSGKTVTSSDAWTVSFMRATVALGDGVEAMHVDEELSTDITVPGSGWAADTADAKVFDTWYDYNPSNHLLTPVAGSWLIRDAAGNVWGMAIDSYYDEHGTSATYQVEFVAVEEAE